MEEYDYEMLAESFHGYVGLCPKCYEKAMWIKDGERLGQEYHLVEFERAKNEAAKNVTSSECLRFKLQCGCEIGFDDEIILVDEALAHPVQIFNKLGYITTNCCAGHPFEPIYYRLYLDFNEAYSDILTAYKSLAKRDEFKHIKLIKHIANFEKEDEEKTDNYELEPNGEFRYIGSVEGCRCDDEDDEYFALTFDRSVYEVLTRDIYYKDLATWVKNSEMFFKSNYAEYGPMCSTVLFIKCLYLLIEELMKMRQHL